jgi:hypothetical protein
MTLSHASPLVQSSASKEARASLTRFIIACSQLFLCFRTNCYDKPLSYVFVSSMFSQSVLPGGPVSQRSLGLVTGPHVGGAEMRRCQARAGASFSVTSSGYSTIPSFSLLSMACARSASAHHYHTFYIKAGSGCPVYYRPTGPGPGPVLVPDRDRDRDRCRSRYCRP